MAEKKKEKKNKKGMSKLSKQSLLVLGVIAAVFLAFQFGGWQIGLIVAGVVLVALLIWHWPTILTLMGQREYALGNNTKALKYLKSAHEHGRSNAAHSSTYAYILLRCGRAEDARFVANYALMNKRNSESDKNQIRQILSLICYKQGDYAEATKIMEELFVTYKTTTVYGTLGYYKILSGSEDMYSFNEEAYEYNSDNKVIIDNKIILHLKKEEYEEARSLSQKSIDAGNQGVEIYYHAGQAEEGLGNTEKALEYYRMARSCTRSFMTTISEAEIEAAIDRLDDMETEETEDEA